MKHFITITMIVFLSTISFGYLEAPNANMIIEHQLSTPDRIYDRIEALKEDGKWNDKYILSIARGGEM